MPLTAKSKSFTALRASTSLSPAAAIDVVRETANQFIGERGVGKVDGKWRKGNTLVLIESEDERRLTLKIAMDQSQRGNLRFDAEVTGADRTNLQVGGLTQCQFIQNKLFGFIPVGPASIVHFGLYERFLGDVQTALLSRDPSASVEISAQEEPVISET